MKNLKEISNDDITRLVENHEGQVRQLASKYYSGILHNNDIVMSYDDLF